MNGLQQEAAYGQDRRLLRLRFPADDGPDSILLANRLGASEGLSRDFLYVVEALSDDAGIATTAVIGRMVTIELVRDDGSLRFFNGHVLAFSLLHTDGGLAFYRMELGPWLAFARLRHNNATFQHLNIGELSDRVLEHYPMRDHRRDIGGADPDVTYLCQHDESDHNFLHRRWEAQGWHYAYEHRADGHTLRLGDDTSAAPAITGESNAVRFQHQAGSKEEDGIHQWRPLRVVTPARATLASFDFKQARPARAEHVSGSGAGEASLLDSYENTGLYGFTDSENGEMQARLRMEERDARAASFAGEGNERRLEPGRWFTLSDHGDDAAQPYLLLTVHHEASNNYQDGADAASSYRNSFTCIERDVHWRPGRGFCSVEPRIHGAQTAIVVGPPGEEIHTDAYGRVKLQFHWDRIGAFNERSSPWVRVMSGWAGTRFGHIAVPRVGMEVVVQFIDGCVDRPLVVGCVYNARNMPPWPLPANRTQSGVLTRSTAGGRSGQANALRFEDRLGAEEVWLHAEKNQRIEVEHDERHAVGHDRAKTIARDETVKVGRDRAETVRRDARIAVHGGRIERIDGSERIAIGGERDEQVAGNECLHIRGKKNTVTECADTETVALADVLGVGGLYAVTVGAAMQTLVGAAQTTQVGGSKVTNVGKAYSISASDSLTITVGAATFSLHSDGSIIVRGAAIDVAADAGVRIDGKQADVN